MTSSPSRQVRRVTGRALPLRGDDIDTDRIIPARFLRSVSFDGLGEHLFADERGPGHPIGDPRYAGAAILVVNRNFGCGSSREHAPQAIYRRGIHAIIGESFSEIFLGNAVAIGLPCMSLAKEEADALQTLVERDPRLEITVEVDALRVSAGASSFSARMIPAHRQALVTGAWDSTGMLLEAYDAVIATANRLPYLREF